MPIYDQGYRRHEARSTLRGVRSWPIMREALRLVLSKRAYIGLMVLAMIPFVVRVVQVYIVTRFPQAGRVLPVDAALFGTFLNQQIGFTILLSIFGGAGLIANDLRTGAILVYLSRPLTRRDYVIGKLGVLLALNLAVTLVPGLVLYATAASLAPDIYQKWALAWVGPAIALHAVLISLVISLVALAVSSLARSARVAGLGFLALILGLDVVRAVLHTLFRVPETTLVSLEGNLKSVGNALFGISERWTNLPWWEPTLLLAAVGLVCLATLRARVRAVEIVR
jgi:ABC-2 type transport system permease protein